MNQKGFGIKEFVIVISVIFIAMIIIMSLYQGVVSEEKETKKATKTEEELTYQDLEQELKKAAERYQNDNYSGNALDTEVWSLSYSMLKEEKYLDKLTDPNDKKVECTGYVEFIQDKAKISYKPFLKCGSNYETEGYDSNIN